MQAAPRAADAPGDAEAFAAALAARDPTRIGTRPAWRFLRFLVARGYLLHGTPVPGPKALLEARAKAYGQPDGFSNATGIYAAADALWPIMYAIRGARAEGQMDMCLRLARGAGWSAPVYFHALGTTDHAVTTARALMGPGAVHVLGPEGFVASPPYEHGGLGRVREAHLVASGPVAPLLTVPVTPEDLPLTTRLYDAAAARRAAAADPWGFPWLGSLRPERRRGRAGPPAT